MGRGGRWGARTWQKRARLEGSPDKQESSGFQVRGRVAGCFCRLPVAPRQSHSRAAVEVAGFPTGSPGGRGRGGPCTAAGARPLRLSPGQVQAAIRRAPERCSAPRNARLLRGRPRPYAPSPPPPPLLGARLLQLLRISANPGGQSSRPGCQRR